MTFALLFWILMLFWLVYGWFYQSQLLAPTVGPGTAFSCLFCSVSWGGGCSGRRSTKKR